MLYIIYGLKIVVLLSYFNMPHFNKRHVGRISMLITLKKTNSRIEKYVK